MRIMDLHGNPQAEFGKLEHIVSQFLLKSLHIILDSRIPSLRPQDRSGDLLLTPRVKKSDRWFNLVLGDRPAALENLNFWHRNLLDPMIIDIILVHEETNSSVETVIERWVVQYDCQLPVAPQICDSSIAYKKTYKKSIILLRSLYSKMRLLPAYRIFRQLCVSSQSCNFDIIYKVSSFSDPFSRAEEGIMEECSFTPVEALPGCLRVSVTYRSTLSDFNLQHSTSFPPKIIMDYVGSPNTDPMRSFPMSEKGVRATSFPLRGIRHPSSIPLQRPHSWTSGLHRAAPFSPNQPLGGSPPAYRASLMPYDYPSLPTGSHGNRFQNHRILTQNRGINHDEYQLSPPFSPAASPSPPTHFSPSSPMQTRMHPETAPVSIPLPITGKSSRYLSPNCSDPSRSSLPPLSPKSTKNDPSWQESTSGIRSYRKTETSRTSDMHPGITNYAGQKILKDNKDDSGRFSGLLSSSGSPRFGFSGSSSRLSFQDDLDDGDFSCPFDVDDVETPDFQASQNMDGKGSSEFTSHTLSIGKKSQDAAVGILVHMLRTAPPLRQDPSYSSHSLRAEGEGGVTTASGVFMPRKTADALEDLKSYKEMKDLLLSRSGTRVLSKDEAFSS